MPFGDFGNPYHPKISGYIVGFTQKFPAIYSVSSSLGSDVARLFAKHSSKSCAPSEIARTQKQRVCARVYKLRMRAYITARRWRDGE